MHSRRVLLACGVVLLGIPALAGTKAQMNIVPVPGGTCTTGTCGNGKTPCTGDADCNIGSMSGSDGLKGAASKIQFDGHLKLGGSFKKITNGAGAAVTTDQIIGTDDDYLLRVCIAINTTTTPNTACIYLKVDVKKGNGKIKFDGSSFAGFFPAGTPVRFDGAAFFAPPANEHTACPGDNSNIVTQVYTGPQAACENGGELAVGGIQFNL